MVFFRFNCNSIYYNTIDPRNTPINVQAFNEKKIKCEYYNKDVHKGSFFLPNKYEKNNLIETERLGSTIIIDISDIESSILNNIVLIRSLLDKICQEYKLNIVGKSEKVFKPQGLTVNYLLSESHLTIHTWPEKGKCCIDLFTCGDFKWYIDGKYNLSRLLAKFFNISKSNIRVSSIEREV